MKLWSQDVADPPHVRDNKIGEWKFTQQRKDAEFVRDLVNKIRRPRAKTPELSRKLYADTNFTTNSEISQIKLLEVTNHQSGKPRSEQRTRRTS